MLLLIDSDTLSSTVRFEPSNPGGAAFPHVLGPVNLDAILEAAPYRPGPMVQQQLADRPELLTKLRG